MRERQIWARPCENVAGLASCGPRRTTMAACPIKPTPPCSAVKATRAARARVNARPLTACAAAGAVESAQATRLALLLEGTRL